MKRDDDSGAIIATKLSKTSQHGAESLKPLRALSILTFFGCAVWAIKDFDMFESSLLRYMEFRWKLMMSE